MNKVLALHGFTGTPGSFAALRDLSLGSVWLTPPLTGHANPPVAPEVASFEAEVERLSAWLDQSSGNDTEPPLLLGYSLGGRLALGLALRDPARFRALVLLSCNAGLELEADRQARRHNDALWIDLLQREGLSAFVDRWQEQPLFQSQRRLPAALLEAERVARLSHTAHGLAHSLAVTGLGHMPNYWPRLAELRLPVFVLAGELDPRFVAMGQRMAGSMACAHFTEVPGAGHNLLLEGPSAVLRAIEKGLHS